MCLKYFHIYVDVCFHVTFPNIITCISVLIGIGLVHKYIMLCAHLNNHMERTLPTFKYIQKAIKLGDLEVYSLLFNILQVGYCANT